MPAIKKKWMKASHDEVSGVNAEKDKIEDDAKADESIDSSAAPPIEAVSKPVKRNIPQGPSILKRLDGEVLQEKRKRFIPPAELKLSEWLDNNFEKRSDVNVKLTLMYKHYTELCQNAASDILVVPDFNQMIRKKFGKTFGLQETSAYKAVLKERKVGDKKAKGSGIKMKDIILEAMNHFGNPWLGVRFFALKRYIGSRYPALHIDLKPKLLKRALERGVNFGYFELVKGVGMAGFYKLPGGEPPPPKPKEKAKKDEATEGDENETPTKEKNDDKEEEVSKDEEAEPVKKKKIIKKVQSWSLSKISFGSPRLVEDTFPLALTYQSAPKTASILRIRRYIQDKYGETVTDHRWRQALESGVTKGYWEHISGSGITGTLHLQMDDFNPSSSQIEDMICAAIIACHEPKAASANQIKKYVTMYHTEFGIDQRPDRFKKALLRAVEKKMLTQLTGIGAAGTYQMTIPFTPSPAMLAGDDDSEAEDDGEDGEPPSYVPRGTKSRGMPKVKTMEAVHSPPKKSKVGALKRDPSPPAKGRGRNLVVSSSKGKGKPVKKPSPSKSRMKNGRKRAPSPLTDEEEDEKEMVEYVPRKSKSRGSPAKRTKVTPSQGKKKTSKLSSRGKPAKKPAREPEHEDSLDEDNDVAPEYTPLTDDEEEMVEYTPSKSKSRGSNAKNVKDTASQSKKKMAKAPARDSSVKKPAREHEDSLDEDNDVAPEYTPLTDEEEEMAEYNPSKSKSRGSNAKDVKDTPSQSMKKTPKAPSKETSENPRGSSAKKPDSEPEDEDDDFAQEYTPRKSKSRGGGKDEVKSTGKGGGSKRKR